MAKEIIVDAEYDESKDKSGAKENTSEKDELFSPVVVSNGKEIESVRIGQLKKELEEARKRYAGGDYKVNTTFNRLKEAFGLHIKTKPEDISDLSDANNAYKSKASELMRELIDEIKNKNLDPETMKKELGDLVKYFNYDEKMNLYEARTNARAEANKDNVAYKVLEKSEKFINWYRKVDWKKKMAFGLALGAVTLGASAMGQRALGSVAAGVGATAGMEAYHRRKEQKESESQKEKMLKDFENSEEKMDEIMQKLQGEIDGYEKSLDNEQRKAVMRKLLGVAAALGTFAVGTLASEALRDSGKQAFEAVKDFLNNAHSGGSDIDFSDLGGANQNIEQSDLLQKGPIDNENFLTSDNAPTGPNNIPSAEPVLGSEGIIESDVKAGAFAEKILDIKKGSSLEGTLIKHLEGTGLSHEEAGKMAHKMALEYADNNNLKDGPYSLIHEGAKLKISPEGKLVEISGDDHLGYLSENKISTGDKSQAFNELKPKKGFDPSNWQRNDTMAKILENEGRIKSLDLKQEELLREISNAKGIENTRPEAHEELLKVQQDMEQLREANRGLSSNLSEQNAKVSSSTEVPATNKAEPLGERVSVGQENWKGNGSGAKFMRSFENNFGNVKENEQLFSELYDKNYLDINPGKTATNIRTSLFDAYDKKDVFESLKNRSMSGILKDPEAKAELFRGLKDGDQSIFEKMIKAVPPEKHPGESLHKWIARVAFAMENVKKV